MNIFVFAGLVTTIVMSVAVFGAYRRKLNRVKQRVREGGKIAQTKVGPIEYGVTGSGPSALVIHGAGGGYDQGLLLAQSFPQFRVIAPSRFGYLRTPVPENASSAAQAAAHTALLDSLGVSKAVVAGASAGAPSALEMALRYPERVRALILLVPRGYVAGGRVEAPASTSNALVLRLILSEIDFTYWAALRVAPKRVLQFMGVRTLISSSSDFLRRFDWTAVKQMRVA